MTSGGVLAAHVRRGVAITEQAEEVLCATAADEVLAAHRHDGLHTAGQGEEY